MAWDDRLREAAYTSPSNKRLTFDYENVQKTIDKKTTAFEFPDADGTFIQDLGHSGRKYPMRLFFWGENYDLQTNEFETALLERGIGKLEHPIYGEIKVVPFGSIKRRDDLKTAANQAIIEVTFWETIDIVYPTSQADPASSVLSAVEEYNNTAASDFEQVTDIDSAVEQAVFKGTYLSQLNATKTGLQNIANTQTDTQKQFNTINNSLTLGLDILIGEPLTLASQTIIMVQTPARALTSITDRLTGYQGLISNIITGDKAIATPGNTSANTNDFHTRDLYASTHISGAIISVVNNQFKTKTQALAAAEEILNEFEKVTNWRDDNHKSLNIIDTGGTYQQLQEAVALSAGFLVEISFSLKQERSIVLTRNRTIVDLVAELYGSIDDQLDFFIESNNLSGSEILELPRGRELVYYV